MLTPDAASRPSKDLMPSSALPLAYYASAYVGFAAALVVLVADPSLPGASFYQPRFVALVHLVTLAWLTGSILGSFYIVGPLALGVPMRVAKADWTAFAAFVIGVSGMVAHFWINSYDGMAWSAPLPLGAIAWVGFRIARGLSASNIPAGVRLHVVLAFFNIMIAGAIGMLIGFDRSRGFLAVSPLATMFAHVHLAAIGWVMMLVIGLSYRLVPMILPAVMPTGGSLAISAILLQVGVVTLSVQLTWELGHTWIGAVLIAGGIASFVVHVRRMVATRVPRPPALPPRDWSAWQVHAAFAWLLVSAAAGLALSVGASDDYRLPLMWIYGASGLLGFLAQIVVGMQGRLVPMYAWYRAYDRLGTPPPRSAHELISATLARSIFAAWLAGVPLMVWALPHARHAAIRAGAALLLTGLLIAAAHVMRMLRRAIR